MDRTRRRPVADGRLSPRESLLFAAALSLAGLLWLALATTLLAAVVALVTLLTYVVLYTPLKLRTSFATVVGAIPGALPPMIGWAAATDTLSREAWVLFAIIFLWQMPHFLAIAWLFKDDYRRAGFPMLPVVEPDGRSTGYQVAAYASALLPVSLVPSLMGIAGIGLLRRGARARPGFSRRQPALRRVAHPPRRPRAVLHVDRLSAAGLAGDGPRPPLGPLPVVESSRVTRGCRSGISPAAGATSPRRPATTRAITAGSSPPRIRAVVPRDPTSRSSGLSR